MRAFLVWLALLGLLAATAASAYLPMGPWNSVANMAISAVKALLVALFYMELRHSSLRPRLAVAMALFTLALLFSLSYTDYATRAHSPTAWSAR